MALTNNLRKQVDLPTWEFLRVCPTISSAISTTATADNSLFHVEQGRYIYYLASTTGFNKYDTWTDAYVYLTAPTTAPVTWSSMKFSGAYGHECRVLSAGSSTFTAALYNANAAIGYELRIISGTGKGQQRFITSIADPVEADSGVVTSVSGSSTMTDSTKAWAINQWAGYQVRIKYGSAQGFTRKILYNDATTLTFVDLTRTGVDCNSLPSASIMFTPASTAGSQSVYTIESFVATVDSPWMVMPDETSRIRIFSGAIVLLSSSAAGALYSMQVYDILSDMWYSRTSVSNILSTTGTDAAIERTNENATVWTNGKATAGTTTTLTDSSQAWVVNEHAGRWLRISSGTGEGQIRQVASNTATVLTWVTVGTAPDTTSYYRVEGLDAGTATAGGASTLTDSTKSWVTNQWRNLNARLVSGTGIGQVRAIQSNTATALTFSRPWDTEPDSTSVYIIHGDKEDVYVFTQGSAGVALLSMDTDMASMGRSIDDGLVRIGAAKFGEFQAVGITSGTGTSGTITITTAIPHGFKTGWTITHSGDTGASASFNNIAAVITVLTATTYTYAAPSSTAAWTLTALTTSLIKDSTKNWVVNEHANRLVYFTTTTTSGTFVSVGAGMEIASNTANTLTLKTASTITLNGTSKYVITNRTAIGALDSGIATGTHSTTTLQDSTKSWSVNQWAGRRLRTLTGAGMGVEATITSNTATTLTLASAITTPVTNSTSYAILGGTFRGLAAYPCWAFGTTKALTSGVYIYSARGGAAQGFDRLNITTDLWDILNISPQGIETLTTGSNYAYDGQDRIYFTRDATLRMFYLDLNTLRVHGAATIPYVAGTAVIGNRMEIFQTADRLKYLWVNRPSFGDCFRQLLFF